MNAQNLSLSLIVLVAGPHALALADNECSNPATVSGTVTTSNISATLQLGQIELALESHKGRTVYDQSGAVIGRTVKSDPISGQSILNHSIIFEDGSRIETAGDVAQILYPTSACSFRVTESISNMRGSKFFGGASGNITADGTVSFPPCPNENQFTLSGTVCLK